MTVYLHTYKSHHSPYKQRVGGSNPSTPTKKQSIVNHANKRYKDGIKAAFVALILRSGLAILPILTDICR